MVKAMVGQQLSHYRIIEELGQGNMGIVYKARDTKLDRTVAIKVLPSSALSSEEDRARFYREAKAAAQLNNPHIASVFEFDEAVPEGSKIVEPRPFITMEYIDGETLQDRIRRGPLKLDEATRIASQIASGLEAAHEKEIVHRDLKCKNIMLTAEGESKILDFGLALTAASKRLTKEGLTVGTVAYMSPEQARGELVDHRTDLWALGAVLYEMIAGRMPFPGDYEQAVIYEILNTDPEPLTAVRTGVPMQLEWLVNKCLAKSPDERYQSASELIVDLKRDDLFRADESRSEKKKLHTIGPFSGGLVDRAQTGQHIPIRSTRRFVWAGVLLAVVSIIAGAFLYAALFDRNETDSSSNAARRVTISTPGLLYHRWPTISSTGRFAAFTATDSMHPGSSLFLYDFENGSVRMLQEGGIYIPRFSPANDWLLFSKIDSGIYRMRMPDGEPVLVQEMGNFAIWESGSSILYSNTKTGALMRSGIAGRQAEALVLPDSAKGHDSLVFPSLVGTGRYAIATARGIDHDIVIADLESGTYDVLLERAGYAHIVPSGHLVYMAAGEYYGQIHARPFDQKTLRFTGPDEPVRDVAVIRYSQFGIGLDGTFIYSAPDWDIEKWRSVWIDKNNQRVAGPDINVGPIARPNISPDGSRIAFQSSGRQPGERDIYVYHLEEETLLRLSEGGENFWPKWGPDGSTVVYSRAAGIPFQIVTKAASGIGPEEVIDTPHSGIMPEISPDGKWIIYAYPRPLDQNIFAKNMETGETFQKTFSEGRFMSPTFSRDGRYFAYARDWRGTRIYVKEFDGESEYEVSDGPGAYGIPTWSRDGKYLYYQSGVQLFRTRVQTEPTFRQLELQELVGSYAKGFRFALDGNGNRILIFMMRTDNLESNSILYLVQNWFEELKRIAPPR